MSFWNIQRAISIGCLSLALAPAQAFAQQGTRRIAPPWDAHKPNRYALVIGNAAYSGNALVNPVNDAHDISARLRALSFNVVEVENAGLQQIDKAVTQFTASLKAGDVALVYYSGHGIQIDGENYFVPVDFNASNEVEAKYAAYSAQKLADLVGAKKVSLNILILDACRNNPYRRSRGGPVGWAQMQSGKGTFIAFATAPNDVASDNPNGKNGLFTKYLLDALQKPGRGIVDVFQSTTEGVSRESNGRQQPWITMSLTENFFFVDGPAGSVIEQPSEGSNISVVNSPSPPPQDLRPAPAASDLSQLQDRYETLKQSAETEEQRWAGIRTTLASMHQQLRPEASTALSTLKESIRKADAAIQKQSADDALRSMDLADKQIATLDRLYSQ